MPIDVFGDGYIIVDTPTAPISLEVFKYEKKWSIGGLQSLSRKDGGLYGVYLSNYSFAEGDGKMA